MIKYKSKTRTTMAEVGDLPNTGIYIVAYMKQVVYVGKSNASLSYRLISHLYNRRVDAFGNWLDSVRFDWENVRLDVLEPPDDIDINFWLKKVEGLLVRKHKPPFNTQLQ